MQGWVNSPLFSSSRPDNYKELTMAVQRLGNNRSRFNYGYVVGALLAIHICYMAKVNHEFDSRLPKRGLDLWDDSTLPSTPEFEDEDFPYPLTCKKSELYNFLQRNKLIDKAGGRLTFNVALAMHVGMVGHWKHILKDQINTLKECGLLDILEGRLMISYSNGLLNDLFQVMNPLLGIDGGNRTDIVGTTVESTGKPWEGPAMNMIHQYCQEQVQPQNAVVFYIHNKGSSKWRPNWKEAVNASEIWTYGHSLYWRKFMEYFLIERPALCLEKHVLRNASTCGVSWHSKPAYHYAGNFWSASCKYIQQLKPMTTKETGYTDGEMWVGKNVNPESITLSHVNLYDTKELNLYEHLIKPAEYAFRGISNDLEKSQSSLWTIAE